jgi:hypothetical protein
VVPALLLRGLIVGVIAGVLAFGYAKWFGEPLVNQAIAFESAHESAAAEHADHHHEQSTDEELVSRRVQAGIGLFIAAVAFSAALGGLFALVFAYWNGRLELGPRGTAAVLAIIGFVSVGLVPYLIYPANPPAVGSHDTIGARTAQFFGTVLISLAAVALAVAFGRRLRARWGSWSASIVGALSYVVIMLIAQSLLPRMNEVPADFSPELLWHFRITSLGMHVVIWATLGIVYGMAAEQLLRPARLRA